MTKETKDTKDKKPSAFTKPVCVSESLAQIVGGNLMPRTQVTKEVWDYIKKNNLQDPTNKRNIIPDAKLAKVLGSSQPIDMFKLTSAISRHISDADANNPNKKQPSSTPC